MSDQVVVPRFESLLRNALKAEAASLPLRVSPDQIADRARTRQSARTEWRTTERAHVSRLAFALAGAAAIVVFAALALNFYANQSRIGGHPTPSPSPSTTQSPTTDPPPTRAPSVAPSPTEGGLSSGCVDLYDSGGTYRRTVGSLVVSATAPKGWTGDGDNFSLKNANCLFGSSSLLRVTLVGRVYADACNLLGADVEVRTPAEAIAALAGQKGHQTSGPTDVTLGGYQAARFEFSVPADFDAGSECAEGGGTGSMALWWSPGDQHLGQWLDTGVTTVYIVDVDGLAVGVVASNPGAGSEPAVPAELDAIVESLRFEP